MATVLLMKDEFGDLNHATAKSIEQISTLQQETMKSRGLDILLLKDKQLEKLPTDIISKLYEEFGFNNPVEDVKKAVTEWIERCKLDEMHKSRRSDHVR
ncbi:MAG: hypothetical protein U9N09_09040 [Euryarchaeota archaeon]|nr:hypothetical protein [Euryarchaeota archaeon]